MLLDNINVEKLSTEDVEAIHNSITMIDVYMRFHRYNRYRIIGR